MSKQVVDPWLEADQFGPPLVDFNIRPEDVDDPDDRPPLDQHPGIDPEIVSVPVVPAEPVDLEPEDAPSEVIELEDGGSITLAKDKGWWVATLDPGTGANPEKFKGKNKNDLVFEVLKGKLKATQKIREQNLKLKLGAVAPKPATPVVQPSAKMLTADEIFEIKTQLDSNPDLALQTWFQKSTGLSVQQLVSLAQKGAAADASLETEAVGRDFMAKNPDYYPNPQNLQRITNWVGKFKLGNSKADIGELYANGLWTVDNLEEAFQDLATEGFLVKAPKPVSPEPVVPQPRTEERIVRTETRPRAGLGIRTTDVTPAPPPAAPKPPSVEDLDNMTDKQVADTLAAIRRQKILSRRSQ
jgi:hypothetical protein